ncbi:carbohydrate kinase family protein [Candidatus Woesearchaeota archaeon]|nr:MAG: carbohydrate kinase family protein [Candidatus Woesearchaeota archaeon]
MLELLERNNVEFIGRRLDTKTNFSVIIDTKKKSRTIIAYKDEKNQKYVVPKLKTDWIYVASMDKTCLSFLQELVNYAKKKKIKLAINPSMYFVKTAKRKLKKLLTNFEVVVMNKDEAEELYGDYEKSGVKLLCVTDAKNGAEVFYEGHVYKHKVHNIKVVERTGAGDAYASMFVAAYIKGMPIETCCKVALAQSESVISYYGATNKLLTWNELIKSKDIKVEKVKLT